MKFQEKDKVIISPIIGSGFEEWNGLVCRVVKVDGAYGSTYLKPLSDRPDGYGRSTFWWDTDDLIRAD